MKLTNALNLVLSSSSSTRRMLLERLKIPFQISVPGIDETPLANESAIELVERLASEKAKASSLLFKEALIIGCDQVAVVDGAITGKPQNHEDAVTQLMRASGKSIYFYTGLCLLNSSTQREQIAVETFKVTYKTLDLSRIENYLLKEKPYQCAGSIQIEGLGIALIKELEGNDPTALLGLPLIKLIDMLESEGVEVI